MAEIVNLRLARKAKQRAAKQREAEANRAKFGRTRSEKAAHRQEEGRLARDLDGAKRDGE